MDRQIRDAAIIAALDLISLKIYGKPIDEPRSVIDEGDILYCRGFQFILTSDDDGFFYGHPWNDATSDYDPNVCVRIAYPE